MPTAGMIFMRRLASRGAEIRCFSSISSIFGRALYALSKGKLMTAPTATSPFERSRESSSAIHCSMVLPWNSVIAFFFSFSLAGYFLRSGFVLSTTGGKILGSGFLLSTPGGLSCDFAACWRQQEDWP